MESNQEINKLDYVKKTPREIVSLFGYWIPNGSMVSREKFIYNEDGFLTERSEKTVKAFGSELLKDETGFRLSWIDEEGGEVKVDELIVKGDSNFEVSTEQKNPWSKSIILKQEGDDERGNKVAVIRRFTQKRAI